MNRKKNLLILLVVTVVLPFLLTGCFKFSMHLTLNKDGTADMDIIMAASQMLLTMGTGMESSIFGDKREQLDEQGFEITDYSEENMVGFRATKRMQSVEDFSSLGLGDDMGLGDQEIFTVEKGALTTTYHLNADINFGDLLGEESDMMALLAPDMLFILTLPVKPLEHNATSVSDDGKTVEWKLSPTKVNNIQLSARAPNATAIATGAIVGVALLGLIPVFIFIRKRKAGSQSNRKAKA